MAFCPPWGLPRSAPEFPAAVETSHLFAVGRSVSLWQPLPSSGNQPWCHGLPTLLLPLPEEGAVGFPAVEQERDGESCFTYPLSCSHLFKAPPCNVLLIAVEPSLPAVLSLLSPLERAPPGSIARGGPEMLQLGCWRAFQNPAG